jgi:Tfp pilus assembly protein PilF
MPTLSEAIAIAAQHHHAGRLEAAEQTYREILTVDPNQADAWHLLGVIALQLGNYEFAVESISRAIDLHATESVFHSNLGNAFKAQGKLDEAVASYRRALDLNPDAEAHNDLGIAFLAQGNLDEAVAWFRRALAVKPDYSEAYNNLGIAFQAQGKLNEAVDSYRRALELKPANEVGHSNLGTAFLDQGKLDKAIDSFHRALELKPNLPDVHKNLGNAFRQLGQFDDALIRYSRALELSPDYADVHFDRSMLRLLLGDFQGGWPEYEWRWKTKQLVEREFSQPRWDGNPLEERTILLHAEQGFGDTLQFVRYAALVKQKSPTATVIVQCQRSLANLLARCPAIDRLIAEGDQVPPFDFHLPLLGSPNVFQTMLTSIPRNVPYLFADRELVGLWREKMADISGLRIGINWEGRPGPGEQRLRNIPWEKFAALAELPGVRLIRLQKSEGSEEAAGAQQRLHFVDPGPDFDISRGAFMDSAAIMMNLDLVISSDTAVPHLAGALGVPVWVALPFIPDWRWLLDRSDSPWYPTMRLFRQKKAGDWAGVFEDIKVALYERLQHATPDKATRRPI